jgi:NitT/TauT family transport system substrate-binding protein
LGDGRRDGRRIRLLAVLLALLALIATACGTDQGTSEAEGEATAEAEGETPAELEELTVLFPINSPILHGFRVAEEAGYYEEEGLDPTFEFLDGGAEVVSQLVAGNADLGIVPVGNVIEAIESGNTDLRALWNEVYGSIFYIAVPSDSDIESAEDLAGKSIGITDLSGGEVPTVRGIIRSAGLSEEEVELTPIGEGTALAVRALQEGQVDAFGGSVNDIIALQVQGLDLRYIIPDVLRELPASGLVATQETIEQRREAVEGFLRATTKGFYWAQVNPEATLALLQEVTPEQFAEETGELIFEAVVPITWAPEGTPMGFQSVDTWRSYFDFIGAEQPDVPLEEIIISDFIEPANDYDQEAVAEDANSYGS